MSDTYLPFTKEINDMMDKDYEGFIKSLVSIEKNITDPTKLNNIYNLFMDNDNVQLLNDKFEDFTLEQ